MRRRLARAGDEYLPHGWLDALRQLLMFVVAYAGYEIVRGLVGLTGSKPFRDATRIIDFERTSACVRRAEHPELGDDATRTGCWTSATGPT